MRTKRLWAVLVKETDLVCIDEPDHEHHKYYYGIAVFEKPEQAKDYIEAMEAANPSNIDRYMIAEFKRVR